MDWNSVIYSAIGGGGGALLGATIAALVIKLLKKDPEDSEDKTASAIKGGLAALGVIAGLNVMTGLYKNMTLPRIIPLDTTDLYESFPVAEVIEKESPEAFKRMVYPIDRATRNGSLKQQDLNEMREVYFELMGQKMAMASADSLRELENVKLRQYPIFRDKKPEVCTLMLNGEPYPDVSKIIGEEEGELEMQTMANLFKNPPRPEDFVVDMAIGEKLFTDLIVEAAADVDLNNVRPEITGDGANRAEHQKVCDLSARLSKSLMALEDDDYLHAYSYLLSP